MNRILTTISIVFLFLPLQSIAVVLDGKVTTHYDNGTQKNEKHYKNGIPVGDWKSWYEDGEKYIYTSFYGEKGQIKKIEALYPNGALYYSGFVTKAGISKVDSEYDFDNHPIYFNFDNKCGVVVLYKDSKDADNIYQFNILSYRQDGTCEKAEKGNMAKAIARSYFLITDEATNTGYNFPWGELPTFINKSTIND